MTRIPVPYSAHRETASPLDRRAAFALSLGGAALLAQSARWAIPLPFTDVPVTLQVFFVLMAGGLLGFRWGAATVLEYLLLGLAGLPVFAGGRAGVVALLGPTGGYLIGFVAAAALVGGVTERTHRGWAVAGALMAAVALIHGCGAAWWHLMHGAPWMMTLQMAVLPFLPVDALKAVAAWGALQGTWRFTHSR